MKVRVINLCQPQFIGFHWEKADLYIETNTKHPQARDNAYIHVKIAPSMLWMPWEIILWFLLLDPSALHFILARNRRRNDWMRLGPRVRVGRGSYQQWRGWPGKPAGKLAQGCARKVPLLGLPVKRLHQISLFSEIPPRANVAMLICSSTRIHMRRLIRMFAGTITAWTFGSVFMRPLSRLY